MVNSVNNNIQNDRHKDGEDCQENLIQSSQITEEIHEIKDEEENKRELTHWDNVLAFSKKKNIKLFEENELNGIVNALPYIDAFDKQYEEMAKQLIEEEMKLMKEKNEIKNYLKNINIPFTKCLHDCNSLLYKELKRCEENKKFEKLNFDHYNLEEEEEEEKEEEEEEQKEEKEKEEEKEEEKEKEEQKEKEKEKEEESKRENKEVFNKKNIRIENLKKKIKKYETILENSHNALVNIELMDKYKSVSWEEHLKMFSKIDINLQNNINSLKNEIEQINKKRKLHQLSFVDDLTAFQTERKEYKRKSNMVLIEINRLLAENRLLEYKQNVA